MSAEATKAPNAADLLEDLVEETADNPVEGCVADESENSGVEFQVRLSVNKVRVLVDCPDPLANLQKYTKDILIFLEDQELPHIPTTEKILHLMTDAAQPGKPLQNHPLLEGQVPVPSEPARLVWSKEYFAEGWIVDEETDQIDFREKVENCSVRQNELLLRLYHAFDGEPGEDLFGTIIPVEKQEKVKVRCGKGVTQVEEEGCSLFYADLAGRVRFADDTLTVDEVYQITGNVDLNTGNIHHTGSVTVTGDVLAEMTIEAEGDVVIQGMVEESNITCGGSLTVAGGILGGAGHKIRAGCDIEAKYIREADVACEGDVLVTKQISHSRVRSLGSVLVPNGRIAGGETIALRGIRVATAGAPAGTATKLMAGVDYSLQAQVDLYHEKIGHLEASLKPIENALHNAGAKQEQDLSEGIQQVIENMALKRMRLQEAISVQYARVAKLMEASKEEAGFYVVMFKEVWSGTTIWLGEAETRVKKSINKPRVALLREDRARVLPLGEDNMPPEEDHPRCPKKIK